MLRFLNKSDTQAVELTASVCIIGAGIAGLIAATRLAGSGQLRVVVLESGLDVPEAGLDALNELCNPAANYPALVARTRALGGTSLLWSGKLIPLARSDAQPRPHLELAGWPFDISELNQYNSEIEALMGVDRESYEEDVSDRLEPRARLGRNDEDFVLRWPKRPRLENHNLAHVLRREIAAEDNPEIWLGATVVGFDPDPASGKIASLRATNHQGQVLSVRADHYMVAAGALESTRLLLMADRQMNWPISTCGDSLGRYFNDHLGLNVATLRPKDWEATNRTLSDRSFFSAERHLHVELRPEVQKANGVASAYFDIGAVFPESSRLPKTKAVFNALRARSPRIGGRELRAAAQELPVLFRYAQWEFLRRQRYWRPNVDLQIKVWAEQIPCWRNRLHLSERTDSLGVPQLAIDWRGTEAEERTFRLMVRKIDAYWHRHLAGICALRWNPVVSQGEGRLVDAAQDLAHPAGSTRMGTSAANSVVNSDLVVHRIPNLSVASSSVFPTSGSANPTLTIMQLAMRGADAVAARLAAARRGRDGERALQGDDGARRAAGRWIRPDRKEPEPAGLDAIPAPRSSLS